MYVSANGPDLPFLFVHADILLDKATPANVRYMRASCVIAGSLKIPKRCVSPLLKGGVLKGYAQF